MLRTLEAMIDEQGDIRLLERIRLPKNRRVLVTILEEVPLLGWPIATQEGGLENEIGLQAEFAAWDTASDEDWQKMEQLFAEVA